MSELVEFVRIAALFFLGLAIILKPVEVVGLIFLPFEKLFGFKTLLFETENAYYFYNYPPTKKEK